MLKDQKTEAEEEISRLGEEAEYAQDQLKDEEEANKVLKGQLAETVTESERRAVENAQLHEENARLLVVNLQLSGRLLEAASPRRLDGSGGDKTPTGGGPGST